MTAASRSAVGSAIIVVAAIVATAVLSALGHPVPSWISDIAFVAVGHAATTAGSAVAQEGASGPPPAPAGVPPTAGATAAGPAPSGSA